MKIIRVEIVARDKQAEDAIYSDLQYFFESSDNWPIYTWETLEATEEQRAWLEDEYGS